MLLILIIYAIYQLICIFISDQYLELEITPFRFINRNYLFFWPFKGWSILVKSTSRI